MRTAANGARRAGRGRGRRRCERLVVRAAEPLASRCPGPAEPATGEAGPPRVAGRPLRSPRRLPRRPCAGRSWAARAAPARPRPGACRGRAGACGGEGPAGGGARARARGGRVARRGCGLRAGGGPAACGAVRACGRRMGRGRRRRGPRPPRWWAGRPWVPLPGAAAEGAGPGWQMRRLGPCLTLGPVFCWLTSLSFVFISPVSVRTQLLNLPPSLRLAHL